MKYIHLAGLFSGGNIFPVENISDICLHGIKVCNPISNIYPLLYLFFFHSQFFIVNYFYYTIPFIYTPYGNNICGII